MGSIKAEIVANKVLENIRAGRKPSITKTAIEAGYSSETARRGLVQRTKTFRSVIASALKDLPKRNELAVASMLDIRDNALAVLSSKIGRASILEADTVNNSTTKNIQLLSGGATNNDAIKIVFDVAFQKKEGGDVQDPTPPVM